jgi:hypothetical protein
LCYPDFAENEIPRVPMCRVAVRSRLLATVWKGGGSVGKLKIA